MRAFRLAYDGRPFYGFQRQPDVPTVEDALFDALRNLGVLDADSEKPPGYAAAGRTDAGVSAVAQTVAFDCPDWCRPRALNAELPAGVRAWASADVPAEFHARYDALTREYTYHLHAPVDDGAAGGSRFDDDRTALAFDDDRAAAALDALSGRNDFHNLTPDETGTERDLAADCRRDGAFLVLTVRAGGFPRHLVRRLAALVHAVGSGDADLATVDRVLGPEELDGPDGVPTAPASPLVLTGVEYDEEFAVDEAAAERSRAVIEERRVEHETAARVASEVVGVIDD